VAERLTTPFSVSKAGADASPARLTESRSAGCSFLPKLDNAGCGATVVDDLLRLPRVVPFATFSDPSGARREERVMGTPDTHPTVRAATVADAPAIDGAVWEPQTACA
jgi:hypothetical protein